MRLQTIAFGFHGRKTLAGHEFWIPFPHGCTRISAMVTGSLLGLSARLVFLSPLPQADQIDKLASTPRTVMT